MAPRLLFSSVGEVLATLTRRYGLQSKLFESNLTERWPEVAGEMIATHTRPDGIRFKRLYVLVENSVWLQQLTFFKPALLEKINAAAGKPLVTDIVLRIGAIGNKTREEVQGSRFESELRTSNFELPATVREELVHCTEAVKDPLLRTRLESLMSKAWARSAQQAQGSSHRPKPPAP